MLHFRVLTRGAFPAQKAGVVSLIRDNWDDYGFKTLFKLYYSSEDGAEELGFVKIAKTGMGDEGLRTKLPTSFTLLEQDAFSVGQDREYYEKLRELPNGLGQQVLAALRDIAYDQHAFAVAIGEPVLHISLLRSVDVRTVTDQFRRIVHGGSVLDSYRFAYKVPTEGGQLSLGFEVQPEANPPTNVHVLIGSNGVGKTTLLRGMAGSLQEPGRTDASWVSEGDGGELPFVNLVKVSFSAFDPFDHFYMADRTKEGRRVSYVGLRDGGGSGLRNDQELARDFTDSLRLCWFGPRHDRWRAAMAHLYRDPLLAESEIGRFAAASPDDFDAEYIGCAFSKLSSGHKIALLTVTKLVQMVNEKSLVLIDEPESHLHPPLLSALMRAISDLMEERNGIAIVATHSPVVLQEVPRSCVHLISRSGRRLGVHSLDVETFGESTGVLTSMVFGLEVSHTGFHALLKDAATLERGDYDRALARFRGQLGGEGRAVLRSLCYGLQG
ncbi:AAA domain-containing protein, putative AbiEii toxin, Type IV TA system [Georgenia satyanarayanai]|uniref:AAA domain-containing protein, putative AbiEii toxin, Type IV TA system n=1 Tax=Georgenia satyanarayanai TaxID=860221 RepID=A0A2Y9AL50_9MICO|nr:AAA family ATPase [Georgenia satyanarayanai]PYF98296.1 putative AbiEii toxin of type IV toxin-antitoxin system [Georgenia satyanarayanai]SSA45181.1 AAA domain-containing protein, putative AbiEii toxin, Type IV TA system [Georgenia satyanarayanai]